MTKHVGNKKVDKYIIEGDDLIANADVMLDLFQVTQPRLVQLVKEKVAVKFGTGRYDLCTSVRNYVLFLRARTMPNSMSKNIDYHEERARLTKMQADKAEMEVEELAGSLAKVEDVVKQWESILMDVKGKLLSIPSKLATIVCDEDNPAVIQDLIDNYIREALLELSIYEGTSEHTPSIDTSNAGDETTTEADHI